MTARERFCPNCGDSLGVLDYSDPYDTCGKVECDREARNQFQADREERQYRAMEDDYERY